MIFIYMCIACFLWGMVWGIPTANYAAKKGVFATVNAFLPFLILNFLSVYYPGLSHIRDYFFAIACGLVCYWGYREMKKQHN